MRQALKGLAVLAALAVPGLASADVNWTSVAADQISVATISPGGTCTYGGFSVTMDPLLGSTVSSNFCFPGNTGPTGATGAAGTSTVGSSESPGANCTTGGSRFVTGAATTYACNGAVGATGNSGSVGATGAVGPSGSDAPKLVYVDQAAATVDGMFRMDGEPAYWDGAAIWAIDAATGDPQPPTVCSFNTLTYDSAGCSGNPFAMLDQRNIVKCARTGAGVEGYWRQTSSYTPGGTCYGWNGSTCAVTGCPGASALVVSAGSAPDLSGYDWPASLTVEE